MRAAPITVRSVERALGPWPEKHVGVSLAAEPLPLRQDMRTLLTFIRDDGVVGTQAAGNMPLKAIREVTGRFVARGDLETTIEERTYRVRSEEEVWPLHFLRILAEVGGLLKTGRARRWRLTAQGERFLGIEPSLQAAFLLTVWWRKVNWLIAFPFAGIGHALPPFFTTTALAHLRSLPVGRDVSFPEFADKLIRSAGLTWTAPDMSMATMSLRGAIRRMVLDVLTRFDAAECRSQGKPPALHALRITPWGAALLEAVAIVSEA